MATLKAGLIAALQADAGVSAIVGTRVFPTQATRGAARPLIVVHVPSDVRGNVFAGHTDQRVGRAVMECQAATDLVAENLARAVDALLGSYATGGTMSGCVVETCLQQAETDDYVIAGNGSDAGTFVRVVDYRFDYRL